MFGDTPIEELNETQKQTLVTLGTLAAGLSGGLAGGNTAGAVTGAQAGQNELNNNMAGLALVQQMMALHLLNSAAMAEAGSTSPDDLAAQALAKKVKSGLNEVCLQNPMCVVMAIISAQQTRSDVEESNPAGLPIADKDPTGGKLVNPDQSDAQSATNTGAGAGGLDTGLNNTANNGGQPSTGGSTTVTPIQDGPSKDDLAYLNKITQGEHATIRNNEGRPVGSVINDVQKSRPADILIQDDGRWVIRGIGGNIHVVEPNGEVVTSFKNSDKNTTQRLNDGRWSRPDNSKLDEFRSKFSDYVRW